MRHSITTDHISNGVDYHETVLVLGPVSRIKVPVTYFEIKVARKVRFVLTSNEVRFVSLADTFTVQFCKLLKLLF